MMKKQIRKSKLLALFGLVLAGCVGTQHKPVGTTASEFEKVVGSDYVGVIVPVEIASTNESLLRRFGNFWSPSTENVAQAEHGIQEYLSAAKHDQNVGGYEQAVLPKILKNLSNYRRQYVGVIVDDERRIFCNILTTNPREYRDWKRRYVHLPEGAPDCWRIEYVMTKQQCTNFNASYGY